MSPGQEDKYFPISKFRVARAAAIDDNLLVEPEEPTHDVGVEVNFVEC